MPEGMLKHGSCSRDISAAMAFGCVRLDGGGLRSEAALSLSGGVSATKEFLAVFASARTALGVKTRELIVPAQLGGGQGNKHHALQEITHLSVSLLLEALRDLDREQPSQASSTSSITPRSANTPAAS